MRIRYLKSVGFLLVCIALILESCTTLEPIDLNKSDSYFINRGKVVFCERGNRQVYGVKKCEANLNYLEILSRYVVKDDKNIYYKGRKMNGVDYDSFSMDSGVPKDKKNAYVMTQTNLNVIPNVDASSFNYIKDYCSSIKWAKDKNNYYRNYKKVNVDYDSFELLNKKFSRDKDSIYGFVSDSTFFNKIKSGVFKGLFETTDKIQIVNKEYIIVRDSLFYISFLDRNLLKKILLKSKNNIRVLNEHVICIDNLVVFKGEEFKYKEVDSETFEFLESNYLMKYSYDKNNVYFEGKIIANANPQAFRVLDNSFFAVGEKYVFYKEEIIEGDSKSFKKQNNFWRDNQGNKYNYKGIKQK
ncbi:DKNYY domain-containing protein [uncultured Croceitalea sp.]|uniref:DKNYY domain-containing protein n=1 Tax=uncultured Croceitalea sp. TaxID=1798908 RepID=UPI0033066468